MTRDEIEALLPFLANETLDGAERAEVEAAVAQDPELQAELAALRAIRDTMQAEDVASPGAFGLARLMRDVRQAPQETTPEPKPAPWQRPRLWQAAAALLLAVVIGQALLTGGGPDPGGLQLAGGDAAFTVSFRPGTSEEDMRNLLLDAGAEIIGGPSALGFYSIAPLEGVTEAEMRAILSASDRIDTISAAEN